MDVLQTKISELEGIENYQETLSKLSSMIIKFKKDYPEQEEIIEKLENFLIFYKNIVNVIKN